MVLHAVRSARCSEQGPNGMQRLNGPLRYLAQHAPQAQRGTPLAWGRPGPADGTPGVSPDLSALVDSVFNGTQRHLGSWHMHLRSCSTTAQLFALAPSCSKWWQALSIVQANLARVDVKFWCQHDRLV